MSHTMCNICIHVVTSMWCSGFMKGTETVYCILKPIFTIHRYSLISRATIPRASNTDHSIKLYHLHHQQREGRCLGYRRLDAALPEDSQPSEPCFW